MFNRIKVTKATIKPLLQATFPGYSGRTFYTDFDGKVTFHDTNWGGGSRNKYVVISMGTGQVAGVPAPAPWVNPVEGKTVELTEDLVVACHSIFCGKDCGVTFYAHPSRQRMLTA